MLTCQSSGQVDVEKNGLGCCIDRIVLESIVDGQLIQIQTILCGVLLGILIEIADAKLEMTQMIGSQLKADE